MTFMLRFAMMIEVLIFMIFFSMYELTPLLLNLYQDCPRCLWAQIHEKVQMPSGGNFFISAGMGLALKRYADGYRLKGELPPELKNQIEGVFLPDQNLLKKWRDQKSCLNFTDQETGMKFSGMLEECIVREVDGEKVYTPLNFKTRGFDQKEESHDQHYQLQLDCYDLLLQKNGYKTSGTGYLVYYSPQQVRENGMIEFTVQVIQLVTEHARAANLIREVTEVLNGAIPKPEESCEYCAWGNAAIQLSKAS